MHPHVTYFNLTFLARPCKSPESKHHDLLVLRSKVLGQLSPVLTNTNWQVEDERPLPQNCSQSQDSRSGLTSTGTNGSRAQPGLRWHKVPCRISAQWNGKRKKIETQENLQRKKILFCHVPPKSRLRYFLFWSQSCQKFPIRTHHRLTYNICFCLSSANPLDRKMLVTVNSQWNPLLQKCLLRGNTSLGLGKTVMLAHVQT